MVFRGRVKNGVVVFERGEKPPEGVEVQVVPATSMENVFCEGPTLAEQFADVIGCAPELPPDMAAQHDHYLHGAPKR